MEKNMLKETDRASGRCPGLELRVGQAPPWASWVRHSKVWPPPLQDLAGGGRRRYVELKHASLILPNDVGALKAGTVRVDIFE